MVALHDVPNQMKNPSLPTSPVDDDDNNKTEAQVLLLSRGDNLAISYHTKQHTNILGDALLPLHSHHHHPPFGDKSKRVFRKDRWSVDDRCPSSL